MPFIPPDILQSIKMMEETFFHHLSSSIWPKTFLVSSITFFNTLCFALALLIWSINRQTQIRPSKSQSRPEMQKRVEGFKVKKDNEKQQDFDILDFDVSMKSSDDHDDLFYNDWGKPESRDSMVRNFSMDFSAIDVEEEEEGESNDINTANVESPGDEDDHENNQKDDDKEKYITNRPLREMRNDMLKFVSKMNVFSYLSDEAFKEMLASMKYIDLPNAGSPILNPEYSTSSNNDDNDEEKKSRLDGSLYILVTGSVDCCCQFDDEEMAQLYGSTYPSSAKSRHPKLQFTVGPGDLITSQLAMLSDLVKWYRQREGFDTKQQPSSTHPVQVKAVTAENNTRLICVPSSAFLSILDKFPHEVHQVAQTVFGRTQRVTMQTLVKTLGLTNGILPQKDLIVHEDLLGITDCQKACKKAYDSDDIKVISKELLSLKIPNEVGQSVAKIAARQLGTTKVEDIAFVHENSSIIAAEPGSVILQAGQMSNSVYFVIDGELEAGNLITSLEDNGLEQSMKRSILESLKKYSFDTEEFSNDDSKSFEVSHKIYEGTYFSQLTAFDGEVSMVTVRSSTKRKAPTYLLQLRKDAYLSLVVSNTNVLMQSLERILSDDFSPIVHLLDWGIRWRDVPAGSILANKGQKAKSLWVVLNGRLRSGKRNEDGGIMKKEHGRGACVGDIQVLTGDVWRYNVYAIRNSEMAELPLRVLDFIMTTFPTCGVHFAKVIANQVNQNPMKKETLSLHDSDNRLPSYKLSIATVAVVPLCFGSNRVRASNFCTSVMSGLEKIAPSTLVTKDIIKRALGKVANNVKNFNHALKLSRVMGDLEENNRLVLYQAESTFNWWTKSCIEQSDSILLVIDSEEPVECVNIIKFISQIQRSRLTKRIELVVITKKDEAIREETHAWIEDLPFDTSINIVRTMIESSVVNEKDMNRMCRRVTGCSLGLALGGGGARGVAHLGVIKALLDAGVSVDIVGGTSQGAFIGALFAKNPDNFDKFFESARLMADRMASMREKFFDLTLPLVSYFDGRRFNKTIEEIIGPKTKIEYLSMKFFATSTDLRTYSKAVHTKGLCWKYVRASMSLHGYLPPISENGSLLLDGGYTCTVPNEVMSKEMQTRAVIAVDVSREEMPNYYEYGTHLSGFWLLWNSWNPFVETVRVPSMGELGQRLIWVYSSKQQQKIEDNCDLFLAPPVHEYGTLDYHLFDDIYQLGYDYSKPKIEAFIKENRWVVPE